MFNYCKSLYGNYVAAALFDGDWHSNEKDELMREYGFTEEEAEAICEELAEMERTIAEG